METLLSFVLNLQSILSRNNMTSHSRELTSISCASRKPPSSFVPDVRLVLLGKTGSGKSSTANTILGHKAFDTDVSSASVTQYCRRACGGFDGRHLTLLETPGILNTHQTQQDVLKEVKKSVSLLSPGPHAFLLVIPIGRFTQEEKEVVRQIKHAMGSHVLIFSVVVFTHGDLLEDVTSVKHCLMDDCKDLADLVAECGGRYCVFNNQTSKKKEQVAELLALVDSMLHNNEAHYYNIEMLQKVEDSLVQEVQEEWKRMKEEEELLKKGQEEAIKQWYEKELQMAQQKSKEEMEQRIKELKKQNDEQLAIDREQAFTKALEESEKKERQAKLQEMVKIMDMHKEEVDKREALQKWLDKAIKTLQEQTEQVEKMKREMEEKMQKDSEENDRKKRERELRQTEMEKMKVELDKVTQNLEEQCRKTEESKKQMEDMLRHEMERNQKEKEMQAENLTMEKKKTQALIRELKLIRMEIEEHKEDEENLKRQLDRYLRKESDQCDKGVCTLRKQRGNNCSKSCNVPIRKKQCTVTTVIGYAQEMGLMGLNKALETAAGAPCCIQ